MIFNVSILSLISVTVPLFGTCALIMSQPDVPAPDLRPHGGQPGEGGDVLVPKAGHLDIADVPKALAAMERFLDEH